MLLYVNPGGFKNIDYSCHFLILNCRGLNLNFVILAHLLTNGGTMSNPGPTQSNCKPPLRCSNKIKYIKVKKGNLLEILIQRCRFSFSTIHSVGCDW